MIPEQNLIISSAYQFAKNSGIMPITCEEVSEVIPKIKKLTHVSRVSGSAIRDEIEKCDLLVDIVLVSANAIPILKEIEGFREGIVDTPGPHVWGYLSRIPFIRVPSINNGLIVCVERRGRHWESVDEFSLFGIFLSL